MTDCTTKPTLTPSTDDVGLSLFKFLVADETLQSFLACEPVGGEERIAIHRNHVPQYEVDQDGYSCGELRPWIWFQQSGETPPECMNCNTTRPISVRFDVEVVSQDLEITLAVSRALHALLTAGWGKRQMGDIIVQDIAIEDQSDEYSPFSYNAMDDGLHGRNFTISISPDWRLTDGL